MITLLFIIGVAMVALTGRLLALAIALPRINLKRHLREVANYGFQPGEDDVGPVPSRGAAVRAVALAERIGSLAITSVPWLPPLRRGTLTAAGLRDVTVEAVHGGRVLAAGSLFGLCSLMLLLTGRLSFSAAILLAGITAGGWLLPVLAIGHRGGKRMEALDDELPDLIDVLIATVEAGMGLGASLALVANRFKATLGDELRFTVRQQQLGISTSQALEDMLARCDTSAMRSFVHTVTRGESMGLSIAPILRELAIDMRRRRRQAAQERMHKAPVKVLFPMMFLIMPAMMIVLFYPAAHSVLSGSAGL